MKPITASDFEAYVRMVETLPLLHGFTLYRGQPCKGNLLPGIARAERGFNTSSKERKMLEELELLSPNLLPQNHTMLDRIVIAQHFGMKTRLLDWTSNPLAALWFACSSHIEGDVFVYAFDTDNISIHHPDKIEPFEVGAPKIFRPRFNNPRVIAQDGWFTIHGYSESHSSWLTLEEEDIPKTRLVELQIPAESRNDILESLHRHGVSARVLFPDLNGLCDHLNWLHKA